MNRPSFFSLAAACWALLVAIALLLPGARVPAVALSWIDKAAHLLLFMVLAWLAGRALERVTKGRKIGLGMVALYAVLLEALQITVPGRAFDLLDLLAGLAGVALAALALRSRRHASPR